MDMKDFSTFVNFEEEYEKGERYKPGGLCPVVLGDFLGPAERYRVVALAKLGYGAYATGWLARDTVERLSRQRKQEETLGSREAKILERLGTRSLSTDPPLVLQLYDSFIQESANRLHQVLVTEPILSLGDLLKLPGVQKHRRGLVRQLLEALAFIHARGIVHVDLHPSNFGVAVPKLDALSEVDIWTSFGEREQCVRILDFGNAWIPADSSSPRCETPAYYTAPEITFPRIAHDDPDVPWGQKADIWTLACSIHLFFSGHSVSWSPSSGSCLLKDIATLCGDVPDAWHDYLTSNAFAIADCTPERANAEWKKCREWFRRVDYPEADTTGVALLLRRMLVIDPQQRSDAAELLGICTSLKISWTAGGSLALYMTEEVHAADRELVEDGCGGRSRGPSYTDRGVNTVLM
ncbi:kinase-like domain-containing protein [Mycena crocata]|nr:kinase-like domain-containing protein [Mycena crocata]